MSDTVDVLIIGAGASGAAAAWSLSETRMRIVCLEQGDWQTPSRYPSTGRDFETRRMTDYAFSPNTRKAAADYPIAEDASAIKVANFNGVGGGTILYTAHFPRFHPSDFRVRSLDGVADDWPIDYAALAPFYDENDRMVGVSGLAGDPAYPDKAPPMPPLALGRSGATLARGFNALGWHWWPADMAIASRDYEGRARCINLGACIAGCAQGAKASADITYWPAALRAGVELRTRCRVREIVYDKATGRAAGAVYYDADGNEVFQRAEVVIVACNGVGTPRLLLNSACDAFPDGLANSSGQVGRNLMFHPAAIVTGLFDEPQDGAQGPHNWLWSHEFYETDTARGFVRGYMMEAMRGSGPALTALSGMASGQIPFGPDHHRAMRRQFGHTAGFVVLCEDLPEAHNRVTLDPLLKDAHGIPAPRLEYRLSDNSLRMMDHAVAKASEVLKAAGAAEVSAQAPIEAGGWHLMGTARMGDDPERSVVNAWGRSHDVKNLFIVDGSLFVTSAAVNPTCTIQALALYIADAMKRRLADLFD